MLLFLTAALFAAVGNLPWRAPHVLAVNPNGKHIPRMLKDQSASGHVVAISKSAITISDWTKPTRLITLPLHDELAAGSFEDSAFDPESYRVEDVRIGDGVSLKIVLQNKIAFCETICIRERPSGLVPQSQKPNKVQPYHEQQNALNANRKFGTPLPPFMLSGIGPLRRLSTHESNPDGEKK